MAKTIKGINAGTTYIIATYGGVSSTKVDSSKVTVTALDLSSVGSISAIGNQTYTGSAIKVAPTVSGPNVNGVTSTLTSGTDYTVSYTSTDSNNCTTAGSTVTVTVTGKGNYKGTLTTQYQIINATIKVVTTGYTTLKSTQDYTYTGSAQGVGLTATTVDGTTATIYYSTTSGDFSAKNTSPIQITNVSQNGTKVYYQVSAANHNTISGSTYYYTLNMAKAESSLPKTISGDSQAYHNTARATVSKDYSGGTLQYSTDSGSSWANVVWTSSDATTTSSPARTALGSTSVIFRVTGDSNHNNSSNSSAVTLTINQATDAQMTVTLVGGTYSGSAITLGKQNTSEGIGTYYLGYSTSTSTAASDGAITWASADSAITAINAGTYYIYYKFTSDDNHSNDKTYTYVGTATIARLKTATASAVTGLVYNGTTETNGSSQTGVTGSYVSWTGSTTGTNAGSYTAYATPDSNHAWSDGTYAATTVSWSIARRGQTAPVLTGSSVKYHNTASASVKTAGTVANGTATAPGTLTWSNQSRTALGSQTATAYYAATTTNFSASATSTGVTVEVTAATDQSVTVTLSTGLTYNGSSQTLATATSHGCTYYLILGSDGTTAPAANASGWTNGSLSATNAGTYYVWYKGTADSNHSADVSITYKGTVTISRLKTATASAVTGLVYNGTTETNGSSQTGVTGSYVSWTGSTTGTNAGSYTAYATPDSNHAWSDGTYAATTVSWSIARRSQGAPVLNGASVKYHNTATASVKTAGTLSDGSANPGTLTWSNQSRTALGSQTATAYYAATTTNFSASATSTGVTVEVTAATDQSVTVTLSTGLTYNGSSQTLATATSHGCTYYLILGSDSTTAPASNASGWTNGSLSATNAGTYYVWYKGTADSNHSADVSIAYKGTVTIARLKTATASAVTGLVYNGTTETNGSSQTGVTGSYVSWTGSTTGTNAGSYTAYATPDSNHAWSDGTYAATTVSWSIARRGQTAPVLNGAESTYPTSASASLKTAGTVENGTATAPGTLTWSNQTRTVAGSQTATAYYAATTTNFSASPTSAGVTVKVNKGTGSITYTLTSSVSKNCTDTANAYASLDNSKSISIASSSASSTTNTGVTITYSIAVTDSAGSAVYGWSISSDGKTITVPHYVTNSSGTASSTATPKGVYTVKITATAPTTDNYNSVSKTPSASVTLVEVTLTSLTLTLNSHTVAFGSSLTDEPASVIAKYSNDATKDVKDSATYGTTYSSNPTNIVSIS